MALGPGKYDHLCTYVRMKSKAPGARVIVLGGTKGSGFSVQVDASRLASTDLVAILRDMANQIESEQERAKN